MNVLNYPTPSNAFSNSTNKGITDRIIQCNRFFAFAAIRSLANFLNLFFCQNSIFAVFAKLLKFWVSPCPMIIAAFHKLWVKMCVMVVSRWASFWMSIRTVSVSSRKPAFRFSVKGIVARCPKKKVIWVDTQFIVTFMTNRRSYRTINLPIGNYIRNSVRTIWLAIDRKSTISGSEFTRFPIPAIGRRFFIHLRPKIVDVFFRKINIHVTPFFVGSIT